MELHATDPCEYLPWDSGFFGHLTARVRGDTLTPTRAAEIDRWCRDNKVSWLYFLARGDDAQTTRAAHDAGFRLVDVRLNFDREMTADFVPAAPPDISPFVPADLPALQRIARSAYTDSRFYYDGRIPREKCDELYETWTTANCQGGADQVLVARADEQPIGYVTCNADRAASSGHLGLIAVDAAARGKQVGRALVDAALAWAARERLGQMSVVTQGRNIAAQRLYQRAGFVTSSLQLYYHKWYD